MKEREESVTVKEARGSERGEGHCKFCAHDSSRDPELKYLGYFYWYNTSLKFKFKTDLY